MDKYCSRSNPSNPERKGTRTLTRLGSLGKNRIHIASTHCDHDPLVRPNGFHGISSLVC